MMPSTSFALTAATRRSSDALISELSFGESALIDISSLPLRSLKKNGGDLPTLSLDIELTYAFGYLASFSARKLLRLCRSVTSRFLSIFPTGTRGSAVMISMCSGGPLGDQSIDLAGCDLLPASVDQIFAAALEGVAADARGERLEVAGGLIEIAADRLGPSAAQLADLSGCVRRVGARHDDADLVGVGRLVPDGSLTHSRRIVGWGDRAEALSHPIERHDLDAPWSGAARPVPCSRRWPWCWRGRTARILLTPPAATGSRSGWCSPPDASHTCPSLTAESLGPVHERGQLWLGKTSSTPEVAPVNSPGNPGARLASGNGHRCVRAGAAAPDPLGFLMIDNARC